MSNNHIDRNVKNHKDKTMCQMRGRENYPESYRGSVFVFVSVSYREFSFPSTIISTNTAGFNLYHRQFYQSVVRSRPLNANLSLSSDDLFLPKK